MLHPRPAWFETPPAAAPHHDEIALIASRFGRHPEEARSAVSKDALSKTE